MADTDRLRNTPNNRELALTHASIGQSSVALGAHTLERIDSLSSPPGTHSDEPGFERMGTHVRAQHAVRTFPVGLHTDGPRTRGTTASFRYRWPTRIARMVAHADPKLTRGWSERDEVPSTWHEIGHWGPGNALTLRVSQVAGPPVSFPDSVHLVLLLFTAWQRRGVLSCFPAQQIAPFELCAYAWANARRYGYGTRRTRLRARASEVITHPRFGEVASASLARRTTRGLKCHRAGGWDARRADHRSARRSASYHLALGIAQSELALPIRYKESSERFHRGLETRKDQLSCRGLCKSSGFSRLFCLPCMVAERGFP